MTPRRSTPRRPRASSRTRTNGSALAAAMKRIGLTGTVRRIGTVDVVTFKHRRKSLTVALQTVKARQSLLRATNNIVGGAITADDLAEFMDLRRDSVADIASNVEAAYAATMLRGLIGKSHLEDIMESVIDPDGR